MKGTIIEKGTQRAARHCPQERPRVVFQVSVGSLGETLFWASFLFWVLDLYETLVERLYTVVLTDHHVLFLRTGRVFHRVKRVKYAIPRGQFHEMFGDMTWDGEGEARFRLRLPRGRRRRKANVALAWQQEFHYFLTALAQDHQPQGQQRVQAQGGYGVPQAGHGPGHGPGQRQAYGPGPPAQR
ncbi:hypothetical protein [Streptomyces triticirhizae]|uniref:Uncharacterized protein n=1 Tax=Streptomyces triticirhizae TaxID=2483353 RepID=A0A3M2LUW1_9ACTN|nr:hypothetical protein [Streptomyces triticirhizae]RMI41137.1 hypothetical protein EBN88_11615 [Streptomyces triticirhizae]